MAAKVPPYQMKQSLRHGHGCWTKFADVRGQETAAFAPRSPTCAGLRPYPGQYPAPFARDRGRRGNGAQELVIRVRNGVGNNPLYDGDHCGSLVLMLAPPARVYTELQRLARVLADKADQGSRCRRRRARISARASLSTDARSSPATTSRTARLAPSLPQLLPWRR